jgi:hypothetical protein
VQIVSDYAFNVLPPGARQATQHSLHSQCSNKIRHA